MPDSPAPKRAKREDLGEDQKKSSAGAAPIFPSLKDQVDQFNTTAADIFELEKKFAGGDHSATTIRELTVARAKLDLYGGGMLGDLKGTATACVQFEVKHAGVGLGMTSPIPVHMLQQTKAMSDMIAGDKTVLDAARTVLANLPDKHDKVVAEELHKVFDTCCPVVGETEGLYGEDTRVLFRESVEAIPHTSRPHGMAAPEPVKYVLELVSYSHNPMASKYLALHTPDYGKYYLFHEAEADLDTEDETCLMLKFSGAGFKLRFDSSVAAGTTLKKIGAFSDAKKTNARLVNPVVVSGKSSWDVKFLRALTDGKSDVVLAEHSYKGKAGDFVDMVRSRELTITRPTGPGGFSGGLFGGRSHAETVQEFGDQTGLFSLQLATEKGHDLPLVEYLAAHAEWIKAGPSNDHGTVIERGGDIFSGGLFGTAGTPVAGSQIARVGLELVIDSVVFQQIVAHQKRFLQLKDVMERGGGLFGGGGGMFGGGGGLFAR